MKRIEDESVDLIVTSPPYPMIEMWDEMFFNSNPDIRHEFDNSKYMNAFKLMHEELSKVWMECRRVLKEGGVICINIGDATRSFNKNFQLYSNHTIINKLFMDMGLKPLPIILWRKTSNKPNKFMGSGMLPNNAYVTLEHEYILVFRKGEKRKFNSKNKDRYESAYFWEERNKHLDFIKEKKEIKHKNNNYYFGVITSQEKEIKFYDIKAIDISENALVNVLHKDFSPKPESNH
jgi:DNA modification methylase